MAHRISSSQFKSKLRQAQNKLNQARNQYNQAVRKFNADNQRRRRELNTAINQYNQSVNRHNARVRSNRQRIVNELRKLERSLNSAKHPVLTNSTQTLHRTYSIIEARGNAPYGTPEQKELWEYSERENANSLEALNTFLGDEREVEEGEDNLQSTYISDELSKISPDLDARWRGAVFSLSPQNPDASRHFCTSTREIFTEILEKQAPDSLVIDAIPDCDVTPHNQKKPTRRAKIKFFLHRKNIFDDTLEEFIEQDIENILDLFREFNGGTHGEAGVYDLNKLYALKKRAEDGITFLAKVVH